MLDRIHYTADANVGVTVAVTSASVGVAGFIDTNHFSPPAG